MAISAVKLWLVFCVVVLASFPPRAIAALPAVEKAVQQPFPTNRVALRAMTDALFSEYQQQRHVASLVFYAYGMLKLAEQYALENALINAAEYARTGFFYLDEAAEQHEANPRVRYLRARVDAFLPAAQGRCAIALSDTQFLLAAPLNDDPAIRDNLLQMRYCALMACKKDRQAAALLAQAGPQLALRLRQATAAPAWSRHEVSQILLPLMEEKP